MDRNDENVRVLLAAFHNRKEARQEEKELSVTVGGSRGRLSGKKQQQKQDSEGAGGRDFRK